jgi:hypothetical protein
MFVYDLHLQNPLYETVRPQTTKTQDAEVTKVQDLELATPAFQGEQIYLPHQEIVLADISEIKHLIGSGSARPRSIIEGTPPYYLEKQRGRAALVEQYIIEHREMHAQKAPNPQQGKSMQYDLALLFYDPAMGRMRQEVLKGIELANPAFKGESIYLPPGGLEKKAIALAQILSVAHHVGTQGVPPRSIISGKSPNYRPEERESAEIVSRFVDEYLSRRNHQDPSASSIVPL